MSKAWKLLAGMFAGATVLLIALPFALAEAAAPGAAAAAGGAVDAGVAAIEVKKYIAIAAGFCVSFAAFGGALAQGRAASAALEGIARNPKRIGQAVRPDDSRSRPHRVPGHLRVRALPDPPGQDLSDLSGRSHRAGFLSLFIVAILASAAGCGTGAAAKGPIPISVHQARPTSGIPSLRSRRA